MNAHVLGSVVASHRRSAHITVPLSVSYPGAFPHTAGYENMMSGREEPAHICEDIFRAQEVL